MAPAPAAAPAMDVEEGGGGAKNQNNTLAVVKSEDVPTGGFKDGGDHPEVAPDSVEDEGGDTTECSSSFGDTCSGFDDKAGSGEPEVNSQISAPRHCEQVSRMPRKKKVTAEWRNAVRPILWRCQWLELRMMDLSSQVSKYDRELALIKKEKELRQEVSKTNASTPESMAIRKDHRNSSMKRRKRKRHEDIVDTSLYIKKHQILSYYNDKQNKGAEADGLLIDDDCTSPVDGSITGGLDTVALLDAEEYDMIFEQVTLKDILLKIDGIQSQVHLLQDRLRKARLEEENLAFCEDNTHVRVAHKRQTTQKVCLEEEKLPFSEDNTHVRVARKRQSTQRFSDISYTSSTKYRNAKTQKKKNLDILLKDDDGPAFAVRPALPDRETNCQMEDAKGNKREKTVEWNHSRDRTIGMNLLLGADNALPNGHTGDLCKENADDVLINNEATNEGCQQFEKVKHPPSETSSMGHNTYAPAEGKKTCGPFKVDGISPPLKVDNTSPVVKQRLLLEKSPMMKPVKKRGWEPNKGNGSASSSKNQSKEASKTPDAKQKTENTPSSAKEKTESTLSDAMELDTMTPLSAWKKCITGNKSASAKKRKAGNSSSTSKKQKTGKSSSAAKKRKTENSSAAAKKQVTENSSSGAKKPETENSSSAAEKQGTEHTPSKLSTPSPSKLNIEKAVLVAVNSRRSQRVRKPKVFTE